jgi:hypothetical protein
MRHPGVAGNDAAIFQTVVFDTKPYDRESLQSASTGLDIEWRFMDCRLSAATAAAAQGAGAVCTFVNDRLDRPCLDALAHLAVKHIALRRLQQYRSGRRKRTRLLGHARPGLLTLCSRRACGRAAPGAQSQNSAGE